MRVVVRAPNHLGELVLALPALERAGDLWPRRPLVQLPAGLAPLLQLSGAEVEPLPMESRHRLLREALALRRRRPDEGVLLTPSFSSALLFLLAGVPSRRGTDTDARGWMLTDRVDRGPLLEGHRVREYLTLVEGTRGAGRRSGGGPGRSRAPADHRERLPRPRLRLTGDAERAWGRSAASAGLQRGEGPLVGLVPGGRASSRRWPAARWRDLAGRLVGLGARAVVFGGEEERERTAEVAGGRRGIHDLGGRTSLLGLAGGLADCDAVVANDTGPMHLAAALGRPLVAVWGGGDPGQTRPRGDRVRLVGSFDLPCHPCVKNACPRRGTGYRLATARRECLQLVTVDRVERELEELMAGDRPSRVDEGREDERFAGEGET